MQRTAELWPDYARPLGIVAAAGFAASLIVFAYSYTGDAVSRRIPIVLLLHLGVFAVFGPAAFFLHRLKNQGRLFDVFEMYSKPVLAAVVLLFIAIAFAGSLAMDSVEGVTDERPSGYVLVDHGKITALTREQYIAAKAAEDRSFSSIWLLFYGVSALVWLAPTLSGERASIPASK